MHPHASILMPIAFAASFAVSMVAPATAADGEILITHAKALAGGVTPGDHPEYPVTLSVSGSYKLASNLRSTSDAIFVTADGVSIDLNGFQIRGNGPHPRRGVFGTGRSLTVQNGTIEGFHVAGISAPTSVFLIVSNVRITYNGFGIDNPSAGNARIQSNTISNNLRDAIVCSGACHIEGNLISWNSGAGIKIRTGSILGNTIIRNRGLGINADTTTGFGNNTIADNNGEGTQVAGPLVNLQPNACSPVAC